MATKRVREIHDYKQLNSLSSAILWDTAPRQKKAKTLYEVERVITRRRIQYDYEYLIKWKGWSLESCSWEPSTNLTQDLIATYDKPKIANERLQEACRHFFLVVSKCLRSRSVAPVYINMDLDIWRYITYGKGEVSEHSGNKPYQRNDFSHVKYLPENWWYHVNGKRRRNSCRFSIERQVNFVLVT